MTPSHGFGPERRVRKRREYQRAQAGARRVTTAHFVLLVAAQPGAPPHGGGGAKGADSRPAAPRLGLIVTRKVGNAVARNRIKRVCRECFRLGPEWVPPGVDLVVVARAGAETLGLAEAQAEWGAVAGLLKRRAHESLRDAAHVPLAPEGARAHVSRGRGPQSPRSRP